MSKVLVDTIDTRSGTSTMQIGSTNTTTINLGVSGDTVNIPSGVTFANSGTATGFGDNTPAFSVYLNAAMSLTNNTTSKVTYDTEKVDTDSAFASNKFTVPSGGSGTYYFIHAPTIQTTGAGATLCRSYVYVNGSEVARSDSRIVTGTGHYENTPVSTYMATLSESDYVEGYARIESDGSATETVEGATRSWFIGYKLIT